MEFSKYFDHTGLGPTLVLNKVKTLCEEAKKYGFTSVCIPEKFVKKCADILKGSGVKTCTVVGFPHGADSAESKACTAKNAVQNGAEEIDMVISIADALEGNFDAVTKEISLLRTICQNGIILKVIIETCFLNDSQKKSLCLCAAKAGADFIKTSTGFGTGGAAIEDVKLFAECLQGTPVKIKASGGIRTRADAEAMIKAGASRLGTSATISIIEGGTTKENY